MLTDTDRLACEEFCFRRSWRVRLTPVNSRKLIRQTLELLAIHKSADSKWLLDKMTTAVRSDAKCGSILLIILLNIVLPIIVRLIIEWWLSHGKWNG